MLPRLRRNDHSHVPWTGFTVPSGRSAFLVNGKSPDLFDGCTDANGIVAVTDVLGIRFGKKKCGILRRRTEYDSMQLVVDKAEVEFSTTNKAPDIAGTREKAAELRKIAADHKEQLTIDLAGDTTHTIVTAMAKGNGADLSFVQVAKTLDGIHHKCE
jgi:hypothetical protein